MLPGKKGKNTTQSNSKLHPLLPVSKSRNEIRFTHHLFHLLSSTPLTNKPSLQRTISQILGCRQIIHLPWAAQQSWAHAFPFQGSCCLMALPSWGWALRRWASAISTLTAQGLDMERSPGLPLCHLERCSGAARTGKVFLCPGSDIGVEGLPFSSAHLSVWQLLLFPVAPHTLPAVPDANI